MKFNNERITIFKMAVNMAGNITEKTDFLDISVYNDAINKNKVSTADSTLMFWG